jgi:hypothetical protein
MEENKDNLLGLAWPAKFGMIASINIQKLKLLPTDIQIFLGEFAAGPRKQSKATHFVRPFFPKPEHPEGNHKSDFPSIFNKDL